jgi:hypothetical protein
MNTVTARNATARNALLALVTAFSLVACASPTDDETDPPIDTRDERGETRGDRAAAW